MENKNKYLLTTNKLLSQRVKGNGKLYYSLFAFGACIFVTVFEAVPLFTNFVTFENKKEFLTFLCIVPFIIIWLDLFLFLLRVHNRCYIEWYHLQMFPIKKREKKIFYFSLLIFDPKSLLYIVSSCIISAYLFSYALFSGAFIILLIWLLFFLCSILLTLLIYQNATNLIIKYRSQLFLVHYMFLFLFLGTNMTKSSKVYLLMPLTSWVGKSISALVNGDIFVVTYMFYLMVTCLTIFIIWIACPEK